MTATPRRPQTPQARNRQLTDRLRAAARSRNVPVGMVRKQFVFALLFKRLFAEPDDDWLLLGGNALLVRLGGGRFTQDVDLAHPPGDLDAETLLAALRAKVARDPGDGFTFELHSITTHDRTQGDGYGTRAHTVQARALIGGALFEPFSIDVTRRRHVIGPVDRARPTPVIDDPSLADLPEVPVVPLENHVADKVCGMYERHKRGSASTRWRDLADLVRITQAFPLDAGRLAQVLRHEEQRRGMRLPAAMGAPGEQWARRYPAAARDFAEFPERFHTLDASLAAVGACLDPVLDGSVTRGRWDPAAQAWATGG
ncbi:nucleotidyl transferase AbiEii/AbiGii toxin family protein [Kytococcus sedentarius]|uniref:nucleotidyl transferase AbiEii/AbiGii toxin family protein n=1 Tax=Kytococcus sedentarius TaxID=1276 RepID=UPI0035BC8ED5